MSHVYLLIGFILDAMKELGHTVNLFRISVFLNLFYPHE